MPEGPSIVILKEDMQRFIGERVVAVEGNSKIDQSRLQDQVVRSIKSWGKHFLICFDEFALRVHFMMFGSYLIDQKKDKPARLSLHFETGELNLYACSVKFVEGDLDTQYEWSADVMNDKWDAEAARLKLEKTPSLMICDALLEQHIFSGVGNIIKNEVLYRVFVHPESLVGKIPPTVLNEIIFEARQYSFDFLVWKKAYELKKHWLAHTKKVCLRCNLPIFKKYTGMKKRRSFFCAHCQVLYE